ncbi:MAG: glycosyltransferase [Phycisphaerales bacterium]
MPQAPEIAALLLDSAAVVLLIYWSVGLFHVIRTMVAVPTARAGLRLAERDPATPRACLVVPAHNEVAAVGRFIDSIKAQDYSALRVVIVLDRCTDATPVVVRERVAGDARFEVIEVASCPDDWAGKVHAVWRGVRDAAGARDAEVLAFTDADTVFAPGCVRAAVALMRARGLDLLSLLSTLSARRWYELFVQPAAMLETVTQYPLRRAAKATRRKAFANGQFMMFTRAAYDAIGGHEAARGALLEDLALARLIARQHRPAGVFLADGMLTCRMYSSWGEFRRGWTRIFIELSSRRPDRLARYAWRPRVFGCLLPLAVAANAAITASGAPVLVRDTPGISVALSLTALGVFAVVLAALYRLGRMPLWAVPGFIAGSWLVGGLLSGAARTLRRGHAIEWGGRSYALPRRESRRAV